MKKTVVYVDGFNLFYRAFKGTSHKWLDLHALQVSEKFAYLACQLGCTSLVRDAFVGAFEQAAILTNDTDLAEPIRIVTAELKLPVTLLTPVNKPAHDLKKLASHVRHVQPYLGTCQFADPVIRSDGKIIAKPTTW